MEDLPAKSGGKVGFGTGIYVCKPNGNVGHNVCCNKQRMSSRLEARNLANKKISHEPSMKTVSSCRDSKVKKKEKRNLWFVPLDCDKGTSHCS